MLVLVLAGKILPLPHFCLLFALTAFPFVLQLQAGGQGFGLWVLVRYGRCMVLLLTAAAFALSLSIDYKAVASSPG